MRQHPEGPRGPAEVVDGNAIAGSLRALLETDATVVVVECAHCGASAPMATAVVEVDERAAIVRCRGCTRTLFTVLRHDERVELRIAAVASLSTPPA
ncbi:hypothetical protein KIN34_03925 [Cellulomonas sp. DKR-3]|uniref:Uncharacterized protein n=1 Tax=Cellulomonas fulva TaxID=2835530 RepID=A0ABS5TWG1_9CELL|nr:DUF6510 family protein [Cellulomonas fulva]MBT0993432.1 hypothetical protein [Cellulomonas fulva]